MKLTTQVRTIEALRTVMGDCPLQQVAVFLAVAQADHYGDGAEVADIGKKCGLSSASTSRNLSALGDWHWRQKTGLKLVTLVPSMSDRRRKTVQLTHKGKALVKTLEAL